jgi:hypothetical protein
MPRASEGLVQPQIVALLSYYQEPDRFLRDCVKSLAKIGVTKLVALDGAYALYPGAKASSPVSNHRAIEKTAAKAGIETHHFVPDEPWSGNEVHKRWTLFDLAEEITDPTDWWFVVDGDEMVTHAPDDLPRRLADTACGAATATLWSADEEQPLRMFFRAERGLRPRGNHYTYATEDGRVFWGGYLAETEPALDLPVKVEHRTFQRPESRRSASLAFYDKRDAKGAETHKCAWCGTGTQVTIPFGWERVNAGKGATAQRAGVCLEHLRPRLEESVRQAAALGYDALPHMKSLIQHISA